MMRRRLTRAAAATAAAATASSSAVSAADGAFVSAVRTPRRWQSRGAGGDRLSSFVRDNTRVTPASADGDGDDVQSTFADADRGRHRQPRGFNDTDARRSSRSGSSGGRGGVASSGAAAAAAAGADWAARLQQELFADVDPLGGLAHKDYYRDPATGYSPQYAPRNFARGGEIAYQHALSAQDYTDAAAQREWLDHDVAVLRQTARVAAEAAAALHGSGATAAAGGVDTAALLRRHMPADRFASQVPANESVSPQAQLLHSGPTSATQYHRQLLVDQYAASAAAATESSTTGGPLASSLSAAELREHMAQQVDDTRDDSLEEGLRMEFGLRDKERFDFALMQRTSRVPFTGYDMDRFAAQSKGTPYAATQLPPSTPPSSMDEAQNTLRGGGGGGGAGGASDGSTAPASEAYVRSAFARNTVTDQPKLDEAFTEEVVNGLRGRAEAHEQQRVRKRAQRFGLGRQGPLVQDAGPDKRVLKKHTNDERYLNALQFKQNAYRQTFTDESTHPYAHRDTSTGVAHLLGNRFDIQRREDRLSRGRTDLTELNQMHLGTPVLQSVDEFVFRHRNARGERPLDYFKPFPDFRALRLQQMGRDTEGFSLMKQRPEFLEWELFVRFRAHHQQRRELALLHGLEPVMNETAQQRDARRRALDELCERTPFDPSRMRRHDDDMDVDVETLRSSFGVYLLPSPTVVEAVTGANSALNLHLHHLNDELGSADTREHLLSARYFNQLLLVPGFLQRVGRGFVEDTVGKAPEPVIQYEQPPEVLKHFNAEERVMYEQYVKRETQKQLAEWARVRQGRRFVPDKQQYGEVVQPEGGSDRGAVRVLDVQHVDDGTVLTISAEAFAKELAAAPSAVPRVLAVDGKACAIVPGSERTVRPLTVRLHSGELYETTDEAFATFPLEVDASARHNHHLDFGIHDYHYNRGNYIETQDVLWEEATARGVEGWSPATHVDGLRPGMPVRARRVVSQTTPSTGVASEHERGQIVEYFSQPFFNPEPRLVTVAFARETSAVPAAEGPVVESVPLADVMIWQRQNYGPERTVGDESHRYQPMGLRRYVDVADPLGERQQKATGAGVTGSGPDGHFLDKYKPRADEETQRRLRTTKQITEIDSWTAYDSKRSDNHRPLSISHRRDYVRQGYLHKYTPWEWIAIQEADQPIIHETVRHDNTGSSHFFSLNRYWRYKARPHGYVRNFENEVRDLLQFVDGVTPWKKAQKIRTYWEVRQHHPMPQFNRPEVAMHRNTAAMLPTHLWETDKKTGKVKAVKDSVRDYQTKTPIPKWVQL